MWGKQRQCYSCIPVLSAKIRSNTHPGMNLALRQSCTKSTKYFFQSSGITSDQHFQKCLLKIPWSAHRVMKYCWTSGTEQQGVIIYVASFIYLLMTQDYCWNMCWKNRMHGQIQRVCISSLWITLKQSEGKKTGWKWVQVMFSVDYLLWEWVWEDRASTVLLWYLVTFSSIR